VKSDLGQSLLPAGGIPSREGNMILTRPAALRLLAGTMEDIADAILAEKPELTVIRGEIPDT
jgi:hypothetical protein